MNYKGFKSKRTWIKFCYVYLITDSQVIDLLVICFPASFWNMPCGFLVDSNDGDIFLNKGAELRVGVSYRYCGVIIHKFDLFFKQMP